MWPSTTLWAAGFFVLGSLLRILSYFYSANSGGDAGAHLALAAQWLQHPVPKVIFDVYPPGHFWLIGAAAVVAHNVVVAGRLLSLALGIASLLIVWKLAAILYDETAAVSSLAVFSLYSLHIGYSATSSAEVSYLFFLLLAIVFFFIYLRSVPRALSYLLFSGLSLSVSESIRYEAWVFFLVMIVALALFWFRENRVRLAGAGSLPLAVFAVSGGAWPVFMMAYSWHRFGNPMYLVSLNSQRVHQWLASSHASLGRQLALMPVAMLLSLSLPGFLAAIYSFFASFRLRLPAIFAGLVGFFAIVQNYQILRGGLEAAARYSLTLGTMFAILSGYGIERFSSRAYPSRPGIIRAVIFLFLFANLGAILFLSESHGSVSDELASISPRLRYASRISAVGNFLRQHRNPQDAVVIDNYNVESNIIADAAGLPLNGDKLEYLASSRNQRGALEFINTEHPRFLVYSDSGTLRQSILLPPGCDGTIQVAGINFTCEFDSRIYRVYEMSYP